jgi:Protein of unknown function, DUF547
VSRPLVIDPVALRSDLRGVDPVDLSGDEARTAFWLNAYNSLVTDWLRLNPPRRSMLRELRLFGRAAYRLAGLTYTPDQIEHGLLRGNRRPPYRPFRTLRAGDPRRHAAPFRFDPRIHFALNCGARSCPAVREYRAAEVDRQLEEATSSYLLAETDVDGRRVVLPGLMRLYRRDFGPERAALEFVAERVPEVREALDGPPSPAVGYGRFDWTATAPAGTP